MDRCATRLRHELKRIVEAPSDGVSAFPNEDDMQTWSATIQAPDKSRYRGLTFRLRVTFPDKYPLVPPNIAFVTPCFHPNVGINGHLCVDILKSMWSPALVLGSVLVSIRSLLDDPNLGSPMNGEAANLWGNKRAYREKVLSLANVKE